jgi:toxin ParE1/3/4
LAQETSETFATEFLTGITEAFEMLRFPNIGAPRPQLGPNLRVIFHRKYAIYYLPVTGGGVIVRVLHGSRDIAALTSQGGFGGGYDPDTSS